VSKLLWVLLPLLLCLGVVSILALRGRRPGRLGLNVLSSLLLLGYVLTTAGLGIFWVANQHLPVFDWHYLFGYATVLLLAIHLAFNLRVVWRWLIHRRQRVSAGVPVVAPSLQPELQRAALWPRRHWLGGTLGVLGLAMATGTAFLFGYRHGRTAIHPDSDFDRSAVGAAVNADPSLALVEQFHEFSSHSRDDLFRRAPSVAWGDAPPPFKRYPDVPLLVLPDPRLVHADRTAADSVSALQTVSALLWHAAGVSEVRGGIHFRTSPSSGALFSTELYLAVGEVAGLDTGLWHYAPKEHGLHRLSAMTAGAEALGLPGAAEAPLRVVASAVFRRSGHKYGDRAYRYILADLGHTLENLRAASAALGWQLRLEPAFDEERVAHTLALNEAEEGVLALVTLWPSAGPTVPAVHGATDRVRSWYPPSPASGPAAPLGVTDAIHRATSLRAVAAPQPGHDRGSASASMALVQGPAFKLQPARAIEASPLDAMARRRSIRRFADKPVDLADLSAVLDAMLRRQGPLLSGAVRLDLVAHAVQGLAPTSWRYQPHDHSLLPLSAETSVRERSRRAALDQDVIGDASVVIVLAIDRLSFGADPTGAARGYRHAFLEAGMVGERLYLEAAARGLGVCAVGAFYDDEAARLVASDPTQEWVIHLAALGIPA